MPAPSQNTINAIELAANVALAAIPYTAAFAPMIASLEVGLNPLITSLISGSSTTQNELAAFGASLAVIKTLRTQTGIAPELLAKLDEYETAAQNGLVAALAAGVKGYDPSLLTPVEAIA
jgi:hypothetical protein